MKLSVSLSDNDVEFLDAYAQTQGIQSRSAVLHRAVRLLRATEMTADYEDAWQEWASSDDAGAWDATSPDGLSADAAR
jgi:Arc/MetJ-type ribon-helix-helix transcriptional regulator